MRPASPAPARSRIRTTRHGSWPTPPNDPKYVVACVGAGRRRTGHRGAGGGRGHGRFMDCAPARPR